MLVEITLQAEMDCAEALCDALLECGALSVWIEDAHADTAEEHAMYGEPGLEPARMAWSESRLRVLADPEDVDYIVSAAGSATGSALRIEQRAPVQDTDWVRATQAQFAPIRISQRLWIVPSWHQIQQPDALVVRLDPGIAFGTGAHPTTRLCLSWLDQNIRPEARVLDYGCGSGILAIAAAKLGAGAVVGTDIDPRALDAARSNTQTNGVLASYTDPDRLTPRATFDIVLANILSNPLKLLAPALLNRVAPGGSLVLSGILDRQTEEVIAAYRTADAAVPLSVWRCQDGWACLAGSRAVPVVPIEH